MTVVDTPSIEAVIQQAQDGDRDAFCALYRIHIDQVYKYVARRTPTRQDTEDVVQEVFLRALRSLPRYNPSRGSFVSWLYGIARTTLIDMRRRELPAPDRSDPCPDLDPATKALGAWSDVAVALRSLPEPWQEILLLRNVEGLSADETGQIIGRSGIAVRVAHHKAIRALRSALTP